MNDLRRLWVLGILVLAGAGGCLSGPEDPAAWIEPEDPVLYKQRMRELVIALGKHARTYDSEFILIPQNGNELLTADGRLDFVRSYDIDVGNRTMWWMGMVEQP